MATVRRPLASIVPVLLVPALLAASLAACAPPASDPGSSPEPSAAAQPPTPTDTCLGGSSYDSSSVWIDTDAGRFDVGLVGEGYVTAIFVHQLNANACGWFLYAASLAEQGVRAMLLNLCGSASTECEGGPLTDTGADAVLAAADWARSEGAQRVVVAGASIGGTTALLAAVKDADGDALDGVADLSGPVVYDGRDLRGLTEDIEIPAFLVIAPNDSVAAVSSFEELAAGFPHDDVTLITDANGHGWDTLNGPGGEPGQTIGEQLAAFILG